ncbi:MAG: M14 family metallopeptidase [Planctomycetota bacterium]
MVRTLGRSKQRPYVDHCVLDMAGWVARNIRERRIPMPKRRRKSATPAHPDLLTRAEHSRWTETSTHAEVEMFCSVLAQRSDRVRLESMGRSGEGRDMPVLILATDGAFTPEAARRKGKAIVLVEANIHAGEVEGKESVLMIARDMGLSARVPSLLKRLTLVLVPNFNPDGNDRISKKHRALDLDGLHGQIGPDGGVGTRYTGEGWNLNRDATKQDAVESHSMGVLYRKWWPHLFVDCHTTDGSVHRYDLTFDTAHNPLSGHPAPVEFVRDVLLPATQRNLLKRTGIHTTWYGNWVDENDPRKGWETYPALPRFGSHYRGLCGTPDVLLEAYSYIDFEKRGRAMREMLMQLLRETAARAGALRGACARAATETISAGQDPVPGDMVAVNYGVARRDGKGNLVFDWPAHDDGPIDIRSVDAGSIKAHRLPGKGVRSKTWPKVHHLRRFVPTTSVQRPAGYLVPKELGPRLEGHGIQFEKLGKRGELDVEASVVTARERTWSPDVTGPVPKLGKAKGKKKADPRWETVFTVRREGRRKKFPAKTLWVPTAQPLGNLAIYLLEPESDDGFARWGYLDKTAKVGKPFPVWRVLKPLG